MWFVRVVLWGGVISFFSSHLFAVSFGLVAAVSSDLSQLQLWGVQFQHPSEGFVAETVVYHLIEAPVFVNDSRST